MAVYLLQDIERYEGAGKHYMRCKGRLELLKSDLQRTSAVH